LRSGEREWPNPPRFLDTIAEGIRLQQTGQRAFKILRELAEKEVIEVVSLDRGCYNMTYKHGEITLEISFITSKI